MSPTTRQNVRMGKHPQSPKTRHYPAEYLTVDPAGHVHVMLDLLGGVMHYRAKLCISGYDKPSLEGIEAKCLEIEIRRLSIEVLRLQGLVTARIFTEFSDDPPGTWNADIKLNCDLDGEPYKHDVWLSDYLAGKMPSEKTH